MDSDAVPKPTASPSPQGGTAGDSPVPESLPPELENLPFRPAARYYRRSSAATAGDAAASRYPARLVVPTILLAALLAHGLCVRATFYRDDWTQIIDSDQVEFGRWWEANQHALTYFTYWLTHALDGFSPVAFHVGNLVLHLGVALLVAGLGRDLLAEAAGLPAERARRIGWWAGMLFAVHPLGSEVLNYTRWRDLELASLFTLLAARAAVRWRRQRRPGFRWPVATLLAVTAATFCKEVGFILAAGAALLVWFGTPTAPESEVRRAVALPLPGVSTAVKTKLVATPKDASLVKGNWPITLSLGLMAACVAALAWPAWTTAAAALHHPRLGWHTLTKARVFWMYLQRAAVPVGLCSDHQIAWTSGWGDTVAWTAAGAEVLALAGAGWLYLRRGAAAGGSRTVGVLLGVALLEIVYRLANPNEELMVEARMYPALGPLCILLAWGLDRLVRWRKDGQMAQRPLLAACLLGTLLAGGIALSARRALTWRDTPTLVANIVAQYPNQGRAWQELQNAHMRAGAWTEAMRDQTPIRAALERMLAFNRHNRDRQYFPGQVWLTHTASEGNYALALAKLQRTREAFAHLAWVQKSVPTESEVAAGCQGEFLYARGLVNEAAGQDDAAVKDLRESQRLTVNPEAKRELRRMRAAGRAPIGTGEN